MNKLSKVTLLLALSVASFSVYSVAQDSQERLATKHVIEGTYNKDGNSPVAHADSAPTGGGTKDYIPLWLSSTKVGISNIYQNSSGDIGVGTTTPAYPLDVNGDVNTATSFRVGGIQIALGNWSVGNAFLGFSGNETTTGTNNTSLGKSALNQNTSGIENTATGAYALTVNTQGEANTADGYAALYSNTTGTNSTAIGTFALANSTTATDNTAVGLNALLYNTTGTGNTALGVDALLNNTTGSSNIAIGINAGTGTNTGLNNTTAIGYYATASENNAIVLGSTAAQNGAANNFVGIDVGSPTNILTVLQGGGPAIADSWSTYSSRRWKTNIQTLHGALEKVERLRGVSYDLKANGQHEVGVIAEEVGEVVPELVTYEANGKDARGVDYSRLTALLIEATKEQQAQIRHQQELIRAQQAEIRAAQTQNAAQQAQITQLASQIHTIQVSLSTGQQRGIAVRTASVTTAARQ